MDLFVEVALKTAFNNGICTYRLTNAEQYPSCIGKRVRVSLRNRPVTGVIIGIAQLADGDEFKIKDIEEIIDEQSIISPEQLALMKFCAQYYWNPLGACVHMSVPRNEKPYRPAKETRGKSTLVTLSAEQEAAKNIILSDGCERAFLLEGVTGSGKTHVYIHVAHEILERNQSILFLVPEISLTPQLVTRVEQALGIKAAVMHSNITPSKKRDGIFALASGQKRVLIGARSAIFAPLPNLGLIVVDEEHDGSLKQDESPRYHARDLALWRAKNEGARIILGSATPSLESMLNVARNKLVHVVLRDRFLGHKTLPKVSVVDLKERARDVDFRNQDLSASAGQKMCILSRPLVDAMTATLHNGEQVLLFLNQRGYAKFGVCNLCGHLVECPNCSVGLTYYQQRNMLQCHQCDHATYATTNCSKCRHDAIKFLGLGTERLEEEVRTLFPERVVVRLDRDVVRSQRRLEDTLQAMHDQKADILIGTQMVTKGHDFLHVGLVGVVCADMALSLPDFRASEKAFQLLTQVAGRAGRGTGHGHAIIQTYNPEHPSIVCAETHNVADFLKQELAMRNRLFTPPFSHAAMIRCEHSNKAVNEAVMEQAQKILAASSHLTLLGPAPSPIEKIKNRYRMQCMILTKDRKYLHRELAKVVYDQALTTLIRKSRARFAIDVDPYNLT